MKAWTVRQLILLLLFVVIGCDDSVHSDASNDTDSLTDTNPDPEQDSDSSPDTSALTFTSAHLQEVAHMHDWSATDVQGAFSALQFLVPQVADLAAGLNTAVSVYRLTYRTLYQGAEVSASALVAIPQTNVALPILAFQNGTNTLYSSAPTEDAQGLFMKILSASAAMGYVMVIADYLGFGESTQLFHPYLCREITATSLADLLRATVELDDSDAVPFQLSGDLFLAGYSQGGHATMALHEYLESTPDFPLVLQATAAGAGPYELPAVNQYMLSQSAYAQPYFGPYTVLAFQSMGFVHNDLSLYFNAPYAAVIPSLFDGSRDGAEINESLTTDMSQLYTTAIVTNATDDMAMQQLQTAFADNSIVPFAATSPIRLSHGSVDTYIPVSITENFHDAMIAAGTPATDMSIEMIPDQDHESAAPFAIVDAIGWFNELNGY